MTVRAAPRLPAGLVGLLWVAGAVAAFLLLFTVLTALMRLAPEPIGNNAGLFAQAARVTLGLTVVSGVIGLVVGVLAGLARVSSFAPLRWLSAGYIWLIRGTPLLLQILFAYNALPLLLGALKIPVQLSDFWSAVVALSLNVGAYNAEVIRAGIQAVPRGQAEAARSLGLSGAQTMVTVVLPQALRIVIPPLVNNLVSLLKDSSLASVIGILELVNQAGRINSETFAFVEVYITLGVIYLALTTVLTLFTDAIEKRLRVASR